jgi:hypothetical protein
MRNERFRLVLGRNADAAKPGVYAVRQREIDAAKTATNRQCRLAALPRQSTESATLTTCKNDRNSRTGHIVSRHDHLLQQN